MGTFGAIAFVCSLAFAAIIIYIVYRWEKNGAWDVFTSTRKNRLILAIISSLAFFGGIAGSLICTFQSTDFPLFRSISAVSMSLGLYFLLVAVFYKTSQGMKAP